MCPLWAPARWRPGCLGRVEGFPPARNACSHAQLTASTAPPAHHLQVFWPAEQHFLRPVGGRYTFANMHALGVQSVLSAWVRPEVRGRGSAARARLGGAAASCAAGGRAACNPGPSAATCSRHAPAHRCCLHSLLCLQYRRSFSLQAVGQLEGMSDEEVLADVLATLQQVRRAQAMLSPVLVRCWCGCQSGPEVPVCCRACITFN